MGLFYWSRFSSGSRTSKVEHFTGLQTTPFSIFAQNCSLQALRPRSLLVHCPHVFLLSVRVGVPLALEHGNLDRLQRQLLQLKKTPKERYLSISRIIWTNDVATAIPEILVQINVEIAKILEILCQIVKCIVPFPFLIPTDDMDVKVYSTHCESRIVDITETS